MNKLGFYIEVTTVPFLRDALSKVKPPTILIHAGDRGLLREIRSGLSPDSFVIGRIFVPLSDQDAWLDNADPAQKGRDFANQIINYDFGLATETGVTGRLLIDAWMGLNEALRGPASFPNFQIDEQFRRRAAALDSFQAAFHEQLKTRNIEAVAFNFGAGNYIHPEHYLDWFPRTLERYTYLGFHEYGWPTMEPNAALGAATSCTFYRRCMEGIRARYGNQIKGIVSETGLARMYKYPNEPAGDVGWLYRGETIPESQYWNSLQWYNAELGKDSYMLGSCLFEVGHAGRWESFRHLGTDNNQQPILLIDKIATLNTPDSGTGPEPPEEIDPAELRVQIDALLVTLSRASSQAETLPPQVTQLERSLTALGEPAALAAGIPSFHGSLLTRADQLEIKAQQQGAGQAVLDQIDGVKAQLLALQAQVQAAGIFAADYGQAQATQATWQTQANQATALLPQINPLLEEANRLDARLDSVLFGQVPPPAIDDVRSRLPIHSSQRDPTRGPQTIRRLIVHHTQTRDDVTPQLVAQFHVQQGLAGIKYHYLIDGAGTIFWTQSLDLLLPQTEISDVNVDGVAVSLAGNFNNATPKAAQMQAAAHLLAWLLSTLRLNIGVVAGRSELDSTSTSPGTQWLQGARFKDTLLDAIRQMQGGSG